MGKLIFASRHSKRESEAVHRRNELGIDFDEVVLNCRGCNQQTQHNYEGFNFQKRRDNSDIKFNYKCLNCGVIQSFNERK
jgi:RNase P subunit RPR2